MSDTFKELKKFPDWKIKHAIIRHELLNIYGDKDKEQHGYMKIPSWLKYLIKDVVKRERQRVKGEVHELFSNIHVSSYKKIERI